MKSWDDVCNDIRIEDIIQDSLLSNQYIYCRNETEIKELSKVCERLDLRVYMNPFESMKLIDYCYKCNYESVLVSFNVIRHALTVSDKLLDFNNISYVNFRDIVSTQKAYKYL